MKGREGPRGRERRRVLKKGKVLKMGLNFFIAVRVMRYLPSQLTHLVLRVTMATFLEAKWWLKGEEELYT